MDTVTTVIARAAALIPGARSARLATHAAWCCTPAAEVPARFRDGQRAHTLAYLTPGGRRGVVPGAVRFYVTSYGTPVAWVLYDGTTHYATTDDMGRDAASMVQLSTMTRHREAVRAVWPDAFTVVDHTAEGGDVEVSSRPA